MLRRATELRRISADEFVSRMKRTIERPDQRYAFFLGAGCSISSGIPPAGKLARDSGSHSDWLRRLRDVRSPDTAEHKIDEWARKELSSWNLDNPAASYGELIEKLFLTAGDRQREIERLCDEGHRHDERHRPIAPFPNFGYAVLSSLMCKEDGRFNIALTTNFDDLLTDAFFYFQELRPLVIHHDSLAPFIRPTYSRPLVVKLHGDHRLSPLNTPDETASLPKLVAQRVATVLHDRGIVFVGYGGNDESIISMMEQLPDEAIPFGVYWVSGSEPRGIFRPWLESRGAMWVENGDFDELMFRFSHSFEIKDPGKDRYEKVHNLYKKTKSKLFREIADRPAESIEDAQLKTWLAIAVSESDPQRAKVLFESAITRFPDSATLLGNYATFLANDRKDLDRAEEFYKRAIGADPKNARNLGNFATFLANDRKDLERAEEFYNRAIEADSKNAGILGDYAIFLADDRKNLDCAEEFYKQPIDTDPKHANNLGNYANFLKNDRKDLNRAEEFYKRAIDADSKNADILGNYANFLANDRKDSDRAEEFYKRAIEADPKRARNLGNYANFLRNDRKDLYSAEDFYKRAIEDDTKHANILGNYANFLKNDRKDLDRAEEFYKRAIEADPKHANNLGNYAIFLANERKDLDRAEEFYKRAIEADPKSARCLGNYANFLKNDRKDLNCAEEFHKRAIDVDSKNADRLGNYANFLADERKDLDRAEEYYKQAIDADPKHANNLGNYAIFLKHDRKDSDRAEEFYKRAIEADPKHANAFGN